MGDKRTEAIRTAYRSLFTNSWAAAKAAASNRLRFEWFVPPSAQERFEQDFIRRHVNEDPRNAAIFGRLLRLFATDATRAILNAADDFFETLAALPEGPARKLLLGVTRAKAKGKPLTPKAHARNLERAWFVAERVIPLKQLLEGKLWRGSLGPSNGVPWEALLAEMKRTLPHLCYNISKGKALGDLYRRAVGVTVKEKGEPERKWFPTHVGRDLLTEFDREFREIWDEAVAALDRLRQWYAGLTEEERQQRFRRPIHMEISEEDRAALRVARQELLEARRKLKARFSSEEEYQEWQAKRHADDEHTWRASLTRKDLTEERVLRLVWRLPDEDPEEEKQLWQSPLREWFLPEARDGRLRLHRWGRRRWPRKGGGDAADARAAKQQAPSQAPTSPPKPRRSQKPTPSDAKPARKRTPAKSARASRTSHPSR